MTSKRTWPEPGSHQLWQFRVPSGGGCGPLTWTAVTSLEIHSRSISVSPSSTCVLSSSLSQEVGVSAFYLVYNDLWVLPLTTCHIQWKQWAFIVLFHMKFHLLTLSGRTCSPGHRQGAVELEIQATSVTLLSPRRAVCIPNLPVIKTHRLPRWLRW